MSRAAAVHTSRQAFAGQRLAQPGQPSVAVHLRWTWTLASSRKNCRTSPSSGLRSDTPQPPIASGCCRPISCVSQACTVRLQVDEKLNSYNRRRGLGRGRFSFPGRGGGPDSWPGISDQPHIQQRGSFDVDRDAGHPAARSRITDRLGVPPAAATSREPVTISCICFEGSCALPLNECYRL